MDAIASAKPTLVGIPSLEEQQRIEATALRLTILGNIAITLLGVVFAVITLSEAIFLDSLFSGIHLLISLVSLHVSRLIQRPEDEDYPFGYATLEPLLNLGKGLVIAIVAVFALFSSLEAIRVGGRAIEADWAVGYALLAALGCGILAVMQYRFARQSHSPILDLDAKNWLIDGVISGAVAIAFALVLFIQHTSFAWMVPYADPILVMALVLVVIPLPIQTVLQNWKQIVGRAPEATQQEQLHDIAEQVFQGINHEDYHLRPLRIGRLLYVQIYLRFSSEQATSMGPEQVDALRSQLYAQLHQTFPVLAMDLVVTCDRIWIKRAIMPAEPEAITA